MSFADLICYREIARLMPPACSEATGDFENQALRLQIFRRFVFDVRPSLSGFGNIARNIF